MQQVLAFWEAADLAVLRELGTGGFRGDPQERNYRFDNLGKGAAGQAMQNANLITDQPETAGLEGAPLWP